ncbi:Dynein heavy chain 1, axonemal [Echinococcus granulosus]|uniref:Dynein heavy chain 1, axonemal n=2 Tax=Echinococcus TaxID=6209 RepID=W6UQJ7_ECHGR|nr:Dynein heavy chain 1, axonemal [Echinococcus granulosus]EUB63950.1 Dynein heavy chain 1, axonemal [Echinococcus granulosus]
MRSKDVSWYWQKCGVLDYDEATRRWLVQKTDASDRILTKDGDPMVNGGLDSKGQFCQVDSQYWIPRIQLMFLAEDPVVFAKRVAQAYHDREAAEATIRYNLYLDCMPVDGLVEMSQTTLDSITHLAKGSSPQLRTAKG